VTVIARTVVATLRRPEHHSSMKIPRITGLVALGSLALSACTSTNAVSMDLGAPADLAAPPDLAGQPSLLGAGSFTIQGVTDDQYVIVVEDLERLRALPLAGGAPRPISAKSYKSLVSGKSVMTWDTTSSSVSVWTAAGGTRSLSTNHAVPFGALSDDGATLLYVDNYPGHTGYGDMHLARSDGSLIKDVFSQIPLSVNQCNTAAWPAGSQFVLVRCLNTTPVSSTISTVDMTTGAVQDLASPLSPEFKLAPTNDKLMYIDQTANLMVQPLPSGAPVQIETGFTDYYYQRFLPDGKSMVYVNSTADKLRRASTSAPPSPSDLSSLFVTRLLDLSPDGKWAAFTSTRTGFGHDLQITGTAQAGTSTTIVATATAFDGDNSDFGFVFTADSAHIFYLTQDPNGVTGYSLNIVPLAGGQPTTLGVNLLGAWPMDGGRIVFTDHANGVKGDLRIVDANKSDPPTLIAPQVDGYAFDRTWTNVVFTSASQGQPGLYVATLR
jgi:hypothetical protein